MSLQLEGNESSEFSYEITPQGTYRAELERSGGLESGYAVVLPDPGMSTPKGSAVFRYQRNGKVVTEAGVGATAPTTSARIFVDNVNTYTGIAIANRENQTANISFTLLDRTGEARGTTTNEISTLTE